MTRKIMPEDRASLDALMAVVLARAIPEPNTGCLLWLGKIDGAGYPSLTDGEKPKRLSRLILERRDGPARGRYALHSCDVRACVEPRHLRWGTQSENLREAVERGRHANTRRAFCKNGHPLAGDNLCRSDLVRRRARRCRVCANEWNRSRYRAKTEASCR